MLNAKQHYIKNVKRIVVKVGSSTLTYENGRINLSQIENITRQLADLHNRGYEVILVSSGAIGAGIGKLGMKKRPSTIPEKQAAAAVGQGVLLHMYEKLFAEYGHTVGQILLTREDMTNRVRFLNARNSLFSLLDMGVIPIINENDAVIVDEIKVGDNDTLSALVTSTIEADLLILLSDIDGLFNDNPNNNPDAKLLPWIDEITEEVEGYAKGAGSSLGTGGMITKINAAKIAISSGSIMVIGNGSTPNIIRDVLDSKDVGTWFKPVDHPLQARKRWIAFGKKAMGTLKIDNGAIPAICGQNRSLLPSGIMEVNGIFYEGDLVTIININNIEIARGIVNYSSNEIDMIKGLKSYEIKSKLGHKNYDVIVHKDNLVCIK